MDSWTTYRLFRYRKEGLEQWSLNYSRAAILEACQYRLGYLGCKRQAHLVTQNGAVEVGRGTQIQAGMHHKEAAHRAKTPLHNFLRKPQGVHISVSTSEPPAFGQHYVWNLH